MHANASGWVLKGVTLHWSILQRIGSTLNGSLSSNVDQFVDPGFFGGNKGICLVNDGSGDP